MRTLGIVSIVVARHRRHGESREEGDINVHIIAEMGLIIRSMVTCITI